ncbi:MAG: hypothetical protein WCK98_07330 [bacterium]
MKLFQEPQQNLELRTIEGKLQPESNSSLFTLRQYLYQIQLKITEDDLPTQQAKVSQLLAKISYPDRVELIQKIIANPELGKLFPPIEEADRHYSTVTFPNSIIITTNSGPFYDGAETELPFKGEDRLRLLEMCSSEQGIMWRYNVDTAINSLKQNLSLEGNLVVADYGIGSGVYTVLLAHELLQEDSSFTQPDLDRIILDAVDINPLTFKALRANLEINDFQIEESGEFLAVTKNGRTLKIRLRNELFEDYSNEQGEHLVAGNCQDGYHPDPSCLEDGKDSSNESFHAWGSGAKLLENEPHILQNQINPIQMALGSVMFAKEFARRLEILSPNGQYTVNQAMFLDSKYNVPEWLLYLDPDKIPPFHLELQAMGGVIRSSEFLNQAWGNPRAEEVKLASDNYSGYMVGYGFMRKSDTGHVVKIQNDSGIDSSIILPNGIKVIWESTSAPELNNTPENNTPKLNFDWKKFWELRFEWHKDIQGRLDQANKKLSSREKLTQIKNRGS